MFSLISKFVTPTLWPLQSHTRFFLQDVDFYAHTIWYVKIYIQNYNDVIQSISIPTGGLVIEFHFIFFPIPGFWIILNFPDSREI